MKFKPVTIYLAVFAVAVILIFFFAGSGDSNEKAMNDPHANLPKDDIHSKLGDQTGEMPSKENVSQKFKQKVAELKSILEENPSDTASMKELADLQYMAHSMDEALQLYKKILTFNPNRTDVNFAIGVIHYNNKEFDEAEKVVKGVLKYDPENMVAMYNLGAISNARGDKNSAVKYWQSIIDKYPKTHEAFLAQTAIKKMETGEK